MSSNRKLAVSALFLGLTCLGMAAVGTMADAGDQDVSPKNPPLRILETREHIRYGVLGGGQSAPAPTLFVFAGTIETSLNDAYFRQCGNELMKRGFVCVSLDLPSHGLQKSPEEPAGLDGWRWRIEKGLPFRTELTLRISRVLDDLIARRLTDPGKIAACGTSRGGYAALLFAAYEPRVRCAAAFCPVTDLGRLREFKGVEQNPAVKELSIHAHAGRLAGRPVWLVIGDNDERVGTDATIDLARGLSEAARKQKLPGKVDLLVLAEPGGHTTPKGADQMAAAWILQSLAAE